MNHADLDELILRLIAGVGLFRRLERQALADLLRGAAKAAFNAGETVFEEGAEGRSLYVVVRGSFEVYRMSGGKRLRLAEISTGEHFGEIALLGNHRRTASVAALEDSLALRLNQPILDAQPAAAMLLYRNMASMLADRLLTADEEIVFHRCERLTAPGGGEPAALPSPPPSAVAD